MMRTRSRCALQPASRGPCMAAAPTRTCRPDALAAPTILTLTFRHPRPPRLCPFPSPHLELPLSLLTSRPRIHAGACGATVRSMSVTGEARATAGGSSVMAAARRADCGGQGRGRKVEVGGQVQKGPGRGSCALAGAGRCDSGLGTRVSESAGLWSVRDCVGHATQCKRPGAWWCKLPCCTCLRQDVRAVYGRHGGVAAPRADDHLQHGEALGQGGREGGGGGIRSREAGANRSRDRGKGQQVGAGNTLKRRAAGQRVQRGGRALGR